VDDEWDHDLIHVSFDASKVSVGQILKIIDEQGFVGEVRPAGDSPQTK
jgi:hypothetical protein